MKRFIAIFLLSALLIPVTACRAKPVYTPPALITPVRRNMSFTLAAKSVFEANLTKYTASSYSDFYDLKYTAKNLKFYKKYAYIGKSVSAGELIVEADTYDLRLSNIDLNLKIAKMEVDLRRMIDRQLSIIDIEKLQLEVNVLKQKVSENNQVIEASKLYSPVNGVVIFANEVIMAGDPMPVDKTIVKIVSQEKVTVELSMANSSDLFNASLEFAGVEVRCFVDGSQVDAKARLAFPGEKTLYPNDGPVKPIFIEPVSPEYKFPLGSIVQVVFTMVREPDRIVLPQSVIKIINKLPYVRILDSTGKVNDTRVTLGSKNAYDVVIMDGVNEGDKILFK